MPQIIYFGPRPLFLAAEITQEMQAFADHQNTLVQNAESKSSIQKALDFVQQPNSKAAILLQADTDALLQSVKEEFTVIAAAGGLVYSKEGSVLLIFRRDKWDLPKGKLDEGEDLDSCALREVEEETGLQQIKLERPLCITYHTYHQDGLFCLKESHWYLMTTTERQILTPQTDEDIDQCIWVKPEQLAPYLENTHPSIIDVVKKALPLIRELE